TGQDRVVETRYGEVGWHPQATCVGRIEAASGDQIASGDNSRGACTDRGIEHLDRRTVAVLGAEGTILCAWWHGRQASLIQRRAVALGTQATRVEVWRAVHQSNTCVT